jgi:hypothetical protein
MNIVYLKKNTYINVSFKNIISYKNKWLIDVVEMKLKSSLTLIKTAFFNSFIVVTKLSSVILQRNIFERVYGYFLS